MACPNSPTADILDSTELRGALDGSDKTTCEGAQHAAVQKPLQNLATKLRAMQDGLASLRSLPTKPSPSGFGAYGLPLEAAQPLRHLHEQLSRLVRYDGEYPLNMVDGIDTLVLDADTEADLRGHVGALTASINPKHPFLAVLKKEKEDAESGGDGGDEAQQDKQHVRGLASNGKDHTHVRTEEALLRISWLTIIIIQGPRPKPSDSVCCCIYETLCSSTRRRGIGPKWWSAMAGKRFEWRRRRVPT